MNHANYMEGVPVKIAEKYKPPPEIYKLPQSLVNKLNLPENFYKDSPQYQYDLQLEHKALSKIGEWKRIRQRNKNARIERKAKRELQRQEDEKRQRNLLMCVSYPSADELSSSGSETEVDPVESGNVKTNETTATVAECFPEICVTKSVNSFHNILQPTVLSNYNSPTSNTNNSITSNVNSLVQSSLSSSFNYKDFEDDTSSPFDNIELKTINDLDVLAQVLHNTQLKSSSEAVESNGQDVATTDTNAPDVAGEHEENTQSVTGGQPNVQADMFLSENIPRKPTTYLPKFSYDLGNLNSAQEAQNKLNDYSNAAALNYNNINGVLSSQQHQQITGLEHQPIHYHTVHAFGNVGYNYNSIHPQHVNVYALQGTNAGQSMDLATQQDSNKWKSVPDILKELRDEIRNSELRRTRNCSHNLDNNTPVANHENKATNVVVEEDLFAKLDSNAKKLAEQISCMGFPKSRVARVVQLLGADDKKIIEHLIPLSELADLGFDETKISEALLRNENNKNKALDELIS
ncbi:uncharacterized protein LOC101895018 isoform X2 [Musca domestica]|uniref:Uncharacterized protein LOC101895018 isoform X2 n=1 Tax=Musca domestica TaxID=7370 RepID=A0A1I8NHT9_MUSDO|nr:uncharacterized protein LOC101895018 isoform X2 [Musca domestica]